MTFIEACRGCGRRMGEFVPDHERLVNEADPHVDVLCDPCLAKLEDPPGEAVIFDLTGDGKPGNGEARAVCLSALKSERVEWLWDRRIPYGMLTLLVGREGLGKSQLAMMLAATTSRSANVLLLSAEDHPAITLRPRAIAAGANLERLHVATLRRDGMDSGLQLPDDAAELETLAARYSPRLVIIDPIAAHLGGKVNSWSDQGIRSALGPLHRLAERHSCAVLVLAHLNKSRSGDAGQRVGGSIGLPAAVRSALLLARDPEDPDPERGSQRVIAHFKSNIAPQAESLSCKVVTVTLPDGIETSCIRMTGTSDIETARLLDPVPEGDEQRTERDDAADWLEAELSNGPRPVGKLKEEARDAGLSWRTIERAKASMGVQAARVGGVGKAGHWQWSLTPPSLYMSDGGLSGGRSTASESESPPPYYRHRTDIGGLDEADQ